MFAASLSICPAITINGLEDETIYTDSVTFDIVFEDGFAMQALLNGASTNVGSPVTVSVADFYELVVNKIASGSSEIVETETVYFIVRSSERGNSENGLPAFVPQRNIPASNSEIDVGTFELIAPSAFPNGWPIPLVAKLLDGDSRPLRVVADTDVNGAPLRLFRGVGSTHLASVDIPQAHPITIAAASQSATTTVSIAPMTSTVAPEVITTDTSWLAPGIVEINADMEIASAATLTIGPGVIVQIADGVDLTIDGTLQVNGEKNQPAVFTAAPGETWGGCFVHGEVDASYLIVTRGGEDSDWFSGSGFSAHRKEQATFLFDEGSTGTFTDCYWIGNPGQALHVKDATLSLERCLVQRSPTTGQFNGGAVTLRDCHLVEFPIDSPEFADDDNDAIYFTTGDHEMHDTVVGWAKDDGVDAGSGSTGTVLVDGCWFEACFHEGMAWSGGGREVTVRNTVAINNGQGIECGWSDSDSSPLVDVRDSICIGNGIGWRFGDNYDWDYDGFLTVTESLSLYNGRDVWGYEWDSWTYRTDAMDIQGNWLTWENSEHPDNGIWDSSNLALLQALEPTTAPVGAGFADPKIQRPMNRYGEEIEFLFSSFGSIPPGLGFTISAKVVGRPEETTIFGGLRASSGQMQSGYRPSFRPRGVVEYIRFSLADINHGEITTPRHLIYIDTPGVDNVHELVPLGAVWAYLDDGTDPGPGWIEENFDDSNWKSGPAELGYGDGDEATEIDDSPANYPTYYFRREFEPEDLGDVTEATIRLRRDDGAIVYINGIEVARSNMPAGVVEHSDFAEDTVDDEDEYVAIAIDPSILIEDEDNILAVEVHQANASSSDVSFDLELTARRPLEPKLHITQTETGKALVIWNGNGSEVIEESTDLVNWTPVEDASSPLEVDATAPGGHHFYRMRMNP